MDKPAGGIMTLYIVAKNSSEIRPIVKAICNKVGITNYFILDPKFDEVNKPYRFVLFFEEEITNVSIYKKWFIPLRLSATLPVEQKQKILTAFEVIKKEMDKDQVKEEIKSDDLPSIKELDVYLNEFKGSYIEMKLEDRRTIGIYPDGQKLQGLSDVEYHVSALVNMVKIKDLFNPIDIKIKEL
jgi:hypothetical protein